MNKMLAARYQCPWQSAVQVAAARRYKGHIRTERSPSSCHPPPYMPVLAEASGSVLLGEQGRRGGGWKRRITESFPPCGTKECECVLLGTRSTPLGFPISTLRLPPSQHSNTYVRGKSGCRIRRASTMSERPAVLRRVCPTSLLVPLSLSLSDLTASSGRLESPPRPPPSPHAHAIHKAFAKTMRSNGVAHIGNDTFLAVTRDVTDSVFLFSSSFPPAEQLVPLPLSRKARFLPHASLAYDEAVRSRCGESEARAGQPTEDLNAKEALASETAAPTPLLRHSAHASPDGQKIAFISNVRRHHYIVDITAVPAAVCELEMPEVVQSVCWHTVVHHALCVLSISGILTIYDTDQSYLGVIVPLHRRIALRPVIERSLADAEAHVDPSPSSPSTTPAAMSPATGVLTADREEAQSARVKRLRGKVVTARVPPARPHHATTAEAAGSRSLTLHGGDGAIVTTSNIVHSSNHVVAERIDHDEMALVSCADEVGAEGAASHAPSPKPAMLPTSQLELVDMYALPPTESTPVILLLLSSSGDVYAVHLGEDCLPVVATAAVTDDGRVRTREEEKLRRDEVAAAPLNVEVYHLISGADTGAAGDEALAIGGCLVDEDAGTHAVFFLTANGLVKGAWVSEPDLLARHRVARVRAAGLPNISFTLRLSGSLGVRRFLSPAVPSTTHGVSLTLSQNVCIVRSSVAGETTFVIAFPRWDRRRQGWACWHPASADAREREREAAAMPLLSTAAAPPSPIALRLPYDTREASIAVGCTELLLVPEVSKMDSVCERRNTVTISLASLLRSALYARCGKLGLHPSAGADTTSRLRDPHPDVLDLINAVPECHRCWLLGVPEAEMSAATMNLLRRIEQLSGDVNQRELVQAQRRRQLVTRLASLEGRVAEMDGMLAKWQQIILDGIVHRRGGDAFHTANERLKKVLTMLNELEQQL
ncbi:hypothetical protein, conserved [Leishmania tarentolae]|uniref:Uncharacterized protein n=1 Tax=Leishmania tarentolae TaxID=5689 RepID=A0A640KMZ4_LEITA|nr:hypothetical protein, conserved [Leishmania tarentolae]